MKTLLKALLFIILFPIIAPIAIVTAAIIIYSMAAIAGFVFLVLIHILI